MYQFLQYTEAILLIHDVHIAEMLIGLFRKLHVAFSVHSILLLCSHTLVRIFLRDGNLVDRKEPLSFEDSLMLLNMKFRIRGIRFGFFFRVGGWELQVLQPYVEHGISVHRASSE